MAWARKVFLCFVLNAHSGHIKKWNWLDISSQPRIVGRNDLEKENINDYCTNCQIFSCIFFFALQFKWLLLIWKLTGHHFWVILWVNISFMILERCSGWCCLKRGWSGHYCSGRCCSGQCCSGQCCSGQCCAGRCCMGQCCEEWCCSGRCTMHPQRGSCIYLTKTGDSA